MMTIEQAWDRVYLARNAFAKAHKSLDPQAAIDRGLAALDSAHEDLKKAYRDAGFTGPELEPNDARG